MTDPAGAPGPALPLHLLADLHAEVLDERVAAGLRNQVATDPRAREVLAALDATLADLRNLPAPAIPGHVAARLDAALAAEARAARPAAPVADLATRRRRTVWGGVGLVAAAAAVVVGIVALGAGPLETAGSPRVERPALALSGGELGDGLDDALGAVDFGPLSQPAALRACLAANGISQVGAPLGAREVTLDGRPGVLLVLPTGEIARFRLLVVGPGCRPGNPGLLADAIVGR
jgi:hypothetical protein